MLNVHFNGDIVHCPDIKRIREEAHARRCDNKQCTYGVTEGLCSVYTSWLLNNAGAGEFYKVACPLANSPFCAFHNEHVKLGKMQKTFKIDSGKYRKLSSAAHYMVKTAPYKTLFLTLTLGKYKRKFTENELNKCFSNFMDNLHGKKFNARFYIGVRERGAVGKRYHYHLLVNLPHFDFASLCRAWNSAISDICEPSRNSVTSDKKTRVVKNVRSPGQAIRYICKYFAKARGTESKSRVVFISNSLQIPHKTDYEHIDNILKDYKGIYIQQTSDYTTTYRITDSKSFDRFCENYLYPLYELDQKPVHLRAFPVGNYNSS